MNQDKRYIQLKQAAFNAIYKDGCEECGDWVDTLINCYSEEVVNVFGNNPFDVSAALEDLWTTMDYEDPRTGVCLTYRDWAIYFSCEFGHTIYDELIKAKSKNDR